MENVQRKIEETEYFKKSIRKISPETIEFIETAMQSLKREQTPRNSLYFRSPNNKFEIWIAKLPNKESNRGKSGGFRLVYFYVFQENYENLHLEWLEFRKNIGFKNERPKDKEKFQRYLKTLKSELMESLEVNFTCS